MTSAMEKDLALKDLPRIFRRRRRLFVGTTAAALLLSIAVCIFMTRRYQATSTIQLQKSSSDSLGLSNAMDSAADSGPADSMALNVDLQTQTDILQSETLALQVINDLNLEQNGDFKPHFDPIGWVLGFVSPKGIADPAGATLENSPGRRRRVLQIFSKRLKVKVEPGTRLIDVSFTNRDPKVAAAVVNHLTQGLIDFSFRTRFMATKLVSNWLEGQLSDLRKQSESLQSQVVALQQGSGLFGIGETDEQGKATVYSPVLDRLQASTTQLSQATSNRVVKQAVYEVVKTGNAELISQLSGTSAAAAGGGGLNTSLALIQQLRGQESTLEAQLSQDSTRYGAAYPKIIQEQESLKGIQRSIQDEIARIAARSKNDFEIAAQAESDAKATYDSNKRAAEQLNDKSIEYAILSREATQSQDLYQDLLKRLKEAGVLEGLHSSNITVVDPASPPAKPHSPDVPIYLGVGLVAGMLLGCVLALVADATDDRIQDLDQLEGMNLPLLGSLPLFQKESANMESLPLPADSTGFSEAVTIIRSNLLISSRSRTPQVILVTSGSPAEGKSVLAFSLAASLCQTGKQVLLIEGDMRYPVMSRRMGLESDASQGLSGLLADHTTSTSTISLQESPNLSILTAGASPSRPTELLSSERLETLVAEWKKKFDFIVIDSPPVLPVADSQFLEGFADATALVVRSGSTTRTALRRTYAVLSKHAKNPEKPGIGVVLNFVPLPSIKDYYGAREYTLPA